MVVQEDGKILVAGTTDNGNDLDAAVIRLHNDGLPDRDFDHDGQMVINLPDSDDTAYAILLQDDGKIIIAGTSKETEGSQLFLARLNQNGSLDTGFGSNGLVTESTKTDSAVFSAVLNHANHIVLAGYSVNENDKQATLFSFLNNGQPDLSFGNNGLAIVEAENESSVFYDLVLHENNTILAAGTTVGSGSQSALLAGFTEYGKTAPGFNNGEGAVTSNLGINTIVYALSLARDGSVYLAGSGTRDQNSDFILLHYSASGVAIENNIKPAIVEEEEEEESILNFNPLEVRDSLDDEQNYTLTDFASYNDTARAIYVQEDGTVLLAGSAENGKDSDFAVLRFSTTELSQSRQPNGITTDEGYYIATTPPANVTRNSATSGGFIEKNSGSLTVYARGVCYGITSAPGLKDFSDPDTPIVEPQTTTTSDTGETTPEPTLDTDFNPFKTTSVTEGCSSDGSGTGDFRSDILNLSPDTTYYVRAYARLTSSSGSTTTDIYGNELQLTTKDACFIATAAHGSINKCQVTILRQFRDNFLKSSITGKKLIQTYYQLSPPVAELISDHTLLQQITRIVLTPVTLLSFFALYPLFALQLFAALLLTAILFQFVSTQRNKAEHHMQMSSQGFTLIELLVVLVIIGILAGYVGPRIMGHPEDAKRTMAAAQMSSLETALETYRLDNGAYPSTEQGLQALVEAPSAGKLPGKWRKGGYMKKGKVPKDPWGNDYIYLSPGSHSDFDIVSYGSDGESGGEDANADVNNWEIE